jgi:hypothetical protein
MLKKIAWIIGVFVLAIAGFMGYIMLTTKNHSPAAVEEFANNGLSIKVNYCQPFKKGRLIFGEEKERALVPYGNKWRTGANEATEIEFGSDVLINGQILKAGRYSLYTIPGATEWTIVFNSKLGYWGADPLGDPFDESLDVLRAPASVSAAETESEQFKISIAAADSAVTNLNFAWDKTLVTLPIQKN